MTNLAIFASGAGSNADKICDYFKTEEDINVACIVSNKADAGVREIAMKHHVPFQHLSNEAFKSGDEVLQFCRSHRIDYIILAGFLRKIPDLLIKAYSRRILNIHPALLPKYGGKGMYGKFVHQAVKEAGEEETGITIHFVNHEYDKGQIVFQISTELTDTDTPEDIAAKVHELEHRYFPKVIESVILNGQSSGPEDLFE